MEQEIIDTIIAHEEQLQQAMLNADMDQLEALIHEDLLFVIPTGEVVTKAQDLETYRSGAMNLSALEPVSEVDLHLIENNAVVSVVMHMEGTYGDTPFSGDFRFIRVWKKREQWQVIAGSSTYLS